MMKIALTLALLTFSFCEAQNWKHEKIKESGVKTSLTRTTKDYDEIIASGSFKIQLVAGKEGTITLSGDENIIAHIVTEVENNKLKIHFEKNKNYSYKSEIIIKVPFEEISAVLFTGSGDIETKNTITATNFDVRLTGSGEVNLDLNSTNLTTSLSGSGDILISGKTNNLDVSVTGSGNINCSKLIAENATATVAGSGDLKVNCTHKLVAKVAGSGSIKYKEKPVAIEKSVAGSGDIEGY